MNFDTAQQPSSNGVGSMSIHFHSRIGIATRDNVTANFGRGLAFATNFPAPLCPRAPLRRRIFRCLGRSCHWVRIHRYQWFPPPPVLIFAAIIGIRPSISLLTLHGDLHHDVDLFWRCHGAFAVCVQARVRPRSATMQDRDCDLFPWAKDHTSKIGSHAHVKVRTNKECAEDRCAL